MASNFIIPYHSQTITADVELSHFAVTQSEVVAALHVSAESVRRCCKQYRQDGEAAFFAPDKR